MNTAPISESWDQQATICLSWPVPHTAWPGPPPDLSSLVILCSSGTQISSACETSHLLFGTQCEEAGGVKLLVQGSVMVFQRPTHMSNCGTWPCIITWCCRLGLACSFLDLSDYQILIGSAQLVLCLPHSQGSTQTAQPHMHLCKPPL